MAASCSSKSNDSVISLTSSSDDDRNLAGPSGHSGITRSGNNQGPDREAKSLQAPAPAHQSHGNYEERQHTYVIDSLHRIAQYSAQGPELTLPSNFPVRPCDVIPLAKYGYDIRIREIATKLGFQEQVAQEVYRYIGNLEQTEEVLQGMQDAAARRGELKIGQLVAGELGADNSSDGSKR